MDFGDRARVVDLHRRGLSVRVIASRLRLSRSAVGRVLATAVAAGSDRDDDELFCDDGTPNRLEVYRLRYAGPDEREQRLATLGKAQRAEVEDAIREQEAEMAAWWAGARERWQAGPPRTA